MNIERAILLVFVLSSTVGRAWTQSRAAYEQLVAHRGTEHVQAMRVDAHHRYIGELLFYAESFLIDENGELRGATEAEIATIDLHAHDHLRLLDERTGVQDPVLNKHVVLLSRAEFEQLLMGRLNETDRAAYLVGKDRGQPSEKSP